MCLKMKGDDEMDEVKTIPVELLPELEKSREEIANLKLQVEQTNRRINRKENKVKTEENKNRKHRTHSLCFKAAHLEYLFPKLKNMNDAQFVLFANGLKDIPGVQEYVEKFEIKSIGEVEE